MKVYGFRFKGLWMGGTIIIIAKTEDDAFRIAKQHIEQDKKLSKEQKKELKLLETHEIEEKTVFYDNGNY